MQARVSSRWLVRVSALTAPRCLGRLRVGSRSVRRVPGPGLLCRPRCCRVSVLEPLLCGYEHPDVLNMGNSGRPRKRPVCTHPQTALSAPTRLGHVPVGALAVTPDLDGCTYSCEPFIFCKGCFTFLLVALSGLFSKQN